MQNKEKPILFQAEMVRAILDGRKTQTRRVLKKIPETHEFCGFVVDGPKDILGKCHFSDTPKECVHYNSLYEKCPFEIGMELWVRETFALENTLEYHGDHEVVKDGRPIKQCDNGVDDYLLIPRYRATEPDVLLMHDKWDEHDPKTQKTIWKPSIFMPRWASRIQLLITDIRVERLQDISEEDAKSEGVDDNIEYYGDNPTSYNLFKSLWSQINRKESWDANPWVWIIEFERIKP